MLNFAPLKKTKMQNSLSKMNKSGFLELSPLLKPIFNHNDILARPYVVVYERLKKNKIF